MVGFIDVDVLICGAGPVGLILALQLNRMGISTFLAEQLNRVGSLEYGRAAAISPCTLELLEQLELSDELLKEGFLCKQTATFRDGERVEGRGWDFVSRIHDTKFDFILHLRQMYTERVFLKALEAAQGCVREGGRLVDYQYLPSLKQPEDGLADYQCSVELQDGETLMFRSRYIIGADGGKSTVRRFAGIDFQGESTPLDWVRLDAVVETNTPDSRIGPVSIETSTHGNVLWAPMDHDRTRIGFPFTSTMRQKYGEEVSQKNVEYEAIEAVKPFELQLKEVDWWTIYKVGHRLAEHYGRRSDDEGWTRGIFLVGDAAHTHSSGTAQGMNAGIQDATNLAWKLAGVINGWYDPYILETYESERRPAAAAIIELDKSISSLMSGVIPKSYRSSEDDNTIAERIFGEVLDRNAEMTVGLGVHYGIDGILNQSCSAGSISPGYRAPDVPLQMRGWDKPRWLYTIMVNEGTFWILVFLGKPPLIQTNEDEVSSRELEYHYSSDLPLSEELKEKTRVLTVIAGRSIQCMAVLIGVNQRARPASMSIIPLMIDMDLT
ncbi:MAG: hypothetical protein Q9222_006822 [Ikaeria aurantiellina]